MKKYIFSILLTIVLIVNIICLITNVYLFSQIKTTQYECNISKIKNENITDSVVRAADVLLQSNRIHNQSISVSEFDYSYSIEDQKYYIDVSVVPESFQFIEQKYDITEEKVFFQTNKNLFFTTEEYSLLPSLNQIYAVFSGIQKHLYSEWFQNCHTYLISYKGMANVEDILVDPASRNYQVFILGMEGATEVTTSQDVEGENYYQFEIIVDDTVRYVYVDIDGLSDVR